MNHSVNMADPLQACSHEELVALELGDAGARAVPCTVGRRLDLKRGMECSASIVCGASEDQLADVATGYVLHARGILFCPDIIVSAGGTIGLHYRGDGAVQKRTSEIPGRLLTILEAAANDGVQPELAAERMAQARLEGGICRSNREIRRAAFVEMGGLH